VNEYDTIRRIAARSAAARSRSTRRSRATRSSCASAAGLGPFDRRVQPAEDLFTAEDPRRLGSSLVAATLSDLLAAGVEPRFFLDALGLPRDAAADFVDGLAAGIASALDAAGCALAGGDLGTAEPWRFTGFAMGPVASPAPLTRRLPRAPQTLWISGPLGT